MSRPSPKFSLVIWLLSLIWLTLTSSINSWSPEACLLPEVKGRCRSMKRRFYYDIKSQSCRSFIYGGCNANGNNFNTLGACQAQCRGVTRSSGKASTLYRNPLVSYTVARLYCTKIITIECVEFPCNKSKGTQTAVEIVFGLTVMKLYEWWSPQCLFYPFQHV